MSCPKPYVQLTHTTHARSLLLRALRTPSVLGSTSTMFSCDHGIMPHPPYSCTVRFPFSWHPISSRPPRPRPHTRPHFPLPSFFFWGHGHPHAFPAERIPSPLPYPPSARVCTRSAPWPTLSPQREPTVYSIHVVSTSSALRPISVRHYKMPLVLALLLHPHPSRIQSRARTKGIL